MIKGEHRVRQLWFELANGNETVYDIEEFDSRATVTPQSIREGLPRGWKRIEH